MKSSLAGLKTNDGLLKQGIQPDFLTFISSIVLQNRKNTAVELPKGVWVFYSGGTFPDPVRFSKMAAKLFQKAASNETFLLRNSQFSAPCMGLESV